MARAGRKPPKQTLINSPVLQGDLAAPQLCFVQGQHGKSKPKCQQKPGAGALEVIETLWARSSGRRLLRDVSWGCQQGPYPAFWELTSFSTQMPPRDGGTATASAHRGDSPSPRTEHRLILVLLLHGCCLACKTALRVGREGRKTSRTPREIIPVFLKFLWLVSFW